MAVARPRPRTIAAAAITVAMVGAVVSVVARYRRAVDRRFYRSRYVAQQVAEGFTARVRDHVDPRVLEFEWVDVVAATMQPQAVGAWVKER